MGSAEFNIRKQQLAKEIAFLLKAHDCVIIPDFGGFIGNYAPAVAHPVTHVFQPPRKQLVFNRNLRTDDGLLINRLTSSLNVSFHDARQWIQSFSQSLNERLFAGERLDLETVGYFTTDVERNIQFFANTSENHLTEAYGLYPVQAYAINRFPIPERRPDPVFVNHEVVPPVRQNRKTWKRVLQLAPVAIASLLIAFNTSLPTGKRISYADLNPFSTGSEALSVGIKAASGNFDSAARKAFVAPESSNAFSAENAQIFIVAGCYSTKHNADGMLGYLKEKGFDPFILDRTPAGLFRVVYGSYSDITAASDELSDIRKGLNEEAWLLIR